MRIIIVIIINLLIITFAQSNPYSGLNKNRSVSLDITVYTDNKYNGVIEAPVTWNMEKATQDYRVMFYPVSENYDVYVGFTAYETAGFVTANEIYLYRAGTKWDMWHLLGVKYGDEKQNFLAGVDETLSAIYLKAEMDDNNEIPNIYAAEDIYIKDLNRVYIVTAYAYESEWLKYKNTIKKIMKSFYVKD
ncbi:MAG: hypothetical protein PHV30_09985 [Candidatus Margulisbacteria bacterium]|nr:hypothetical protein [Candidatus Margulisiibacteriota bacterium]